MVDAGKFKRFEEGDIFFFLFFHLLAFSNERFMDFSRARSGYIYLKGRETYVFIFVFRMALLNLFSVYETNIEHGNRDRDINDIDNRME